MRLQSNLFPSSYLYWTQRGGRTGGGGGGGALNGLYCLDLDRLKAFDCEAEAVALGNLSAFAVDYLNYRLFYPNETMHTMSSVYLDGSDPVNIRTNTQNPDFSLVSGLAYNAINSTFFWTNGEKLMMEEYDSDHMIYHHNQMFIDGDHFGGVGLWGPGPQPIPGMYVCHCKGTHYPCVIFRGDQLRETLVPFGCGFCFPGMFL